MSFVVAPLISFLHARMHDRTARAKACQSLYGSSLAAVVLPVERALNYSTAPTASAFAALCTSSTELHFEPLHDQIDFIKSQLPAASSLSHPAADLLSSPPTEPDAATSAGSASATFPVVEITQRACVLEPVREGTGQSTNLCQCSRSKDTRTHVSLSLSLSLSCIQATRSLRDIPTSERHKSSTTWFAPIPISFAAVHSPLTHAARASIHLHGIP